MKKKTLATIITALLIVTTLATSFAMLTSCEGIASENNENGNSHVTSVESLNIGIIADVHLLAESVCPTVDIPTMQTYKYTNHVMRMMELSEAVLKASVDRLIELDVDVAFVIGDLTEMGDLISLQTVSEQCARLEAAGIPTFVANGLMDMNTPSVYTYTADDKSTPTEGITAENFVQTMYEFGYSKAVSRDDSSLSYITDIPNTNYRVMMIGTPNYEDVMQTSRSELVSAKCKPMSEARINWIKNSLADAQKYNKDVIVISSIPINETPVSYFSSFVQGAFVSFNEGTMLEDLLTSYGVKYFFNGHTHIDSTLDVETANGKLVEDSTGCLVSYPSTIKKFTISSDNTYKVEKTTINSFNEDYIPENTSAEDKSMMTSNFAGFSKKYCLARFADLQHHNIACTNVNGLPLALSLMKELTIYPMDGNDDGNAALEQIATDCNQWMEDLNLLPIYGAGNTMEGICEPYGIAPPQSEAFAGKTMLDYIFDLVLRMNNGSYIVGNEFDNKMMACVLATGLITVADVNFLARMSEVNELIVPTDMHVMIDNMLLTGTANIKDDNFVLSLLSTFFTFITNNVPWLKIDMFTDADALLKGFGMLLPVVSAGIPEIALFAGENNDFETTFLSLTKGEIYFYDLVSDLLLPIMVRTALTI